MDERGTTVSKTELDSILNRRRILGQDRWPPGLVQMRNSHSTNVTSTRQMQAVVLCGGLGTRLKARLGKLPKVLAPVGGRPFLDYVLGDLRAAGFSQIILCTGYGASAVRDKFGGSKMGLSIAYSQETEPLGTGGALLHAKDQIVTNPFVFLNGDSILGIDYAKLLAKHFASDATATLALTTVVDGSRYGNVQLGPRGKIVEIKEKPANVSAPAHREPALISAGVCVVDRRIFQDIPSDVSPVSFERDVLPRLVGRGLFGEAFSGFFLDIGVPEDYDRACLELPRGYGVASTHSS